MTREEKELLLKDLCARLPYDIKVKYKDHIVTLGGYNGLSFFIYDEMSVNIEEIKPYLRSLETMTKEERKEFIKIEGRVTFPVNYVTLTLSLKEIDWLNRKGFDYRKDDEGKTMIEKGIAIEAPEGMYNNSYGNSYR